MLAQRRMTCLSRVTRLQGKSAEGADGEEGETSPNEFKPAPSDEVQSGQYSFGLASWLRIHSQALYLLSLNRTIHDTVACLQRCRVTSPIAAAIS